MCLIPQILGSLLDGYLSFPPSDRWKTCHCLPMVHICLGCQLLKTARHLTDHYFCSCSFFTPITSVLSQSVFRYQIVFYDTGYVSFAMFAFYVLSSYQRHFFFRFWIETAHFQIKWRIKNFLIPSLLLSPLETVPLTVIVFCKSAICNWKSISCGVGISGVLCSLENNFIGSFSYKYLHINKSMKLFIPLTNAKAPSIWADELLFFVSICDE